MAPKSLGDTEPIVQHSPRSCLETDMGRKPAGGGLCVSAPALNPWRTMKTLLAARTLSALERRCPAL